MPACVKQCDVVDIIKSLYQNIWKLVNLLFVNGSLMIGMSVLHYEAILLSTISQGSYHGFYQ